MIRVARNLVLIARCKCPAPSEIHKRPLPSPVHVRDGGSAILLNVDESGVTGVRHIVLKFDSQQTEIWDEEQGGAEFAQAGGEADLLLTSREHIAGRKRAFDIGWFIAALVKWPKPAA